ncbi:MULTISPECIES: DUF3168 domain-containing protein [unclassified Novosphingobium]|uniref:DUF3168 domain-containing protein n=1 Tax=unclassified Novosphingobium TaxID=2644732 RepID=UPI00135712A6|nr:MULTISPECIES: DUF3168 domain-containing protein [unclassified Novosphingobium]
MDEALRDLLLGTAAITDVVARRVDWGVRPQGDGLPAVTLERISGGALMNMNAPSGWDVDRVQIECWGRTYKAAKDLSLVLASPGGPAQPAGLLVGFRGERLGVRLRTFIVGRRSDSDSDNKGPVHRSSVDVVVWHSLYT